MMNHDNLVEDRLAMLGAALQARPPLTDRVMEELRRVGGPSTNGPTTTKLPARTRRNWRFLTVTAGTALVVAAALVAITLLPLRQSAWA